MTHTLSIDPSVNCLGWALWLNTQLVDAGMSRKPEGRMALDRVCELHCAAISLGLGCHSVAGVGVVWVEQMRLNRGQDGASVAEAIAKGNDLLDVQAVGANVAGEFGRLRYVHVNTWKGTATKKVTENRARNVLTAAELAIVEGFLAVRPLDLTRKVWEGLAHNVWDAVGIGLHGVGRYVLRAA